MPPALRALHSSIDGLSQEFFWLWMAFLIFAAIAGIVALVIGLSRARIILDIPTSRIRSAAQGHVELKGRARMLDGLPIIAPLSRQPCCWYEYAVWRYEVGEGRNSGWQKLDEGRSEALFALDDGTGLCIIDPDDAVVVTERAHRWYNSTLEHSGLTTGRGMFGRDRYRYQERRLEDGGELYAMGFFRTVGTDYQGDLNEDVRDILRDWKADPQALLKRFDKNGDGDISLEEWELARQTAEREALEQRAERSVEAVSHLLARGPVDRRRPFILSALSPKRLVARYTWTARIGVLAFVLGSSAATLLLWLRFGLVTA